MTTPNKTFLKSLQRNIKPDTVILASWLSSMGISKDLQKYYLSSGWLEAIGRGAYKRPGDKITWQSGLYALQHQANLSIHTGALTALSLQGYSHYFRLTEEKVFLFAPRKTNLPKWFNDYDWGSSIHYKQTNCLPEKQGLTEHEERTFTIQISSPERAVLECLYLAPKTIDLVECYHIVEGLANLRPKLITELLQQCKSVKVKRLFLYLAGKANHDWLQFVDQTMIDTGSGSRSITDGGVYISQYDIVIPDELAEI